MLYRVVAIYSSILHQRLMIGLVGQNASLPSFCVQVFAESQIILPGIASFLFPTQHENTASELQSSVEPLRSQSSFPSRPQNGDQTTLARMGSSLMSGLSSSAKSAFTMPTTTIDFGSCQQRALHEIQDNRWLSGDWDWILDKNSTNQARHTHILIASTVAWMSILLALILVRLIQWRNRHRRQAA